MRLDLFLFYFRDTRTRLARARLLLLGGALRPEKFEPASALDLLNRQGNAISIVKKERRQQQVIN